MSDSATIELIMTLRESVSEQLGAITGSLGGVATIAGGAVVAGIGAATVAALGFAGEAAQGQRDLQAQLGLTADQAAALGDVAQDVFANNWGDSLTDVTQIVGQVKQQLKDLDDTQLSGVTSGAIALRDTFGVETAGSIDAVNTLMSNFGLTSQQALDFVTKGFQSGLDRSGDFLDTVGEYSNQFASGGASADQFFSLLQSGLQGGVLGTDKAADAFKEFRVRIQDGSTATSAGLKSLGIDADALTKGMRDGTISAADAFTMVTDKLRATDDQNLRMQAGVSLLGTQYEDLGQSAVDALSLTGTKMADLEGATDSLNAKYGGFGSLWEGFKRQALVAMEPIGAGLLGLANEAMPYVSEGLTTLSGGIEAVVGYITDFSTAIQDGVASGDSYSFMLSDWLYSLDTISPVFATLGDVVAVFGGVLEDGVPLVTDFFAAFAGTGDIGTVADDVQILGENLQATLDNVFGEGAGAAVQPFIDLLYSIPDSIEPIQSAFASLGDNDLAGIFASAAESLQPLVDAFTSGLPGAIALVSATFAALGPSIEAVPGLFDAIVGTVETVASAVGTTFASLIPQAIGIFNQAVLIIGPTMESAGAVAGTVVAGLTAIWQAAGPLIANVVTGIGSVVSAIFGQVSAFLSTNGADITATINSAWAQVGQIIGTAVQVVTTVVQTLTPIIQSVFGAIAGFITNHSSQIQLILTAVWNTIKGVVQGSLTIIQGVVSTVLAAVQGNWSGVWAGIQTITSGALTVIQSLMTSVLNIILGLFNTSTTQLKQVWTTTWESIKATASTAIEAAKSAIASGLSAVKSLMDSSISDIRNAWNSLVSAMENIGHNIIQGVINGVKAMAGALAGAIRDIISAAVGAAQDEAETHSPSERTKRDLGIPLIQGIIVGAQSMATTLASVMSDIVGGAVDGSTAKITGIKDKITAAQDDLKRLTAEQVQLGQTAAGTDVDKADLAAIMRKHSENANAKDTLQRQWMDGGLDEADYSSEVKHKRINPNDYFQLRPGGQYYNRNQIDKVGLDDDRVTDYQSQLEALYKEVDTLAQTDSASAKQLYDLRTKQILDLANLEKKSVAERLLNNIHVADSYDAMLAQGSEYRTAQELESTALNEEIAKRKTARDSEHKSAVGRINDALAAAQKAYSDQTTALQAALNAQTEAQIAYYDGIRQQLADFVSAAGGVAQKTARQGLDAAASLYDQFAKAYDDIAHLAPPELTLLDEADARKALKLKDIKAPTIGSQSNEELAAQFAEYNRQVAEQQQVVDAWLADQNGKLQEAAAIQSAIAENAQAQMAAVRAAAEQLATSDPKAANDFFKLYEGHIIEIAKLQEQLAAADDERTKKSLQGKIDALNTSFDYQKQGFQADSGDYLSGLGGLVSDAQKAAAKSDAPEIDNYATALTGQYNQANADLMIAIGKAMNAASDTSRKVEINLNLNGAGSVEAEAAARQTFQEMMAELGIGAVLIGR